MTRHEKLYQAIYDHASIGAKMPSTRALADMAGVPEGSMSYFLEKLVSAGEIVIETAQSTSQRRAHMVGTTLVTDWSAPHPGQSALAAHGRDLRALKAKAFDPDDIAHRVVYRDPCGRCGARGDYDCGCRKPA